MLSIRQNLRSRAPLISSRGRQRSIVQIRQKTTTATGQQKNAAPQVTAHDFQQLQHELKVLQDLIRKQRSEQNIRQLERRLQSIESHVSKITEIDHIMQHMRDVLQNNPAIRVLLENLKPVTPLVKRYKYAILGILFTTLIVWKYRAKIFYESASEEVADLARRTLEQESLRQSIQDTLQTVANNPSTLHTLNELIQRLIQNEDTVKEVVQLVVHTANTPEVQKALMDVLQLICKDPSLQQLCGEFLLKGLDVESVKAMLDAQTADLVRETVSNDSVQQAAAGAVQRTFWYSITPPILWRYFSPKGSSSISSSSDDPPK